MAQALIYLLIFVPIAVGVLIVPFASKNRGRLNHLILLVSVLAFAASIVVFVLPDVTTSYTPFCGLGINFASSGFHSVLAVTSTFLWLCTALFSPSFFADDERVGKYYTFYLITLGALLGVFYAADLVTLFIFFEVMSMTSYTWVAHPQTKEALKASETYLYISIIGGLVMLMGVFLLYSDIGTLSFEALRTALHTPRTFPAALCILVGFGVKAGMFPLHVWLPRTYVQAPTPATALFSGILSKSGVFGVIIITVGLFSGEDSWGNILLALSVATMFLGALLALFSTDLKRTLACSSMSHIGFMLFGVATCSLLGEESLLAASGVSGHMINHSLIKLALFVAAGVIFLKTKSLDLNDIRGFGRGKPLLTISFLIGACSIIGVPGFCGYISKTLLHEGIVEYIGVVSASGGNAAIYSFVEWMFLISGGLTCAYMARLFYIVFIAKPDHEIKREKYMDKKTSFVLVLCSIIMPAIGVLPYLLANNLFIMSNRFYNVEGVAPAIHYYSFENLKGALISICIGVIVFALVGMRLMTKKRDGKQVYLDLWPKRLDLEYLIYRPLLKGLSFIGAFIARVFASIGGWIFGSILDLIFFRARTTVIPDVDMFFGSYGQKTKRNYVDESFSSDLLWAASGIAAVLIFVFLIV